jgi:glycosyltransferase involved in cell wall biosynthesis
MPDAASIHSACSVNPVKWIALLGCPDKPTDGVEDYCTFLAKALQDRGTPMDLVRVRWLEEGWFLGLWELWRRSAAWRGQWVLLQYTALSWSRRGIPVGSLATLAILRRRGARCAVVFHEARRQSEAPTRWIDRARGACQDWVIHKLYRQAERGIFVDPLEFIGWLPRMDKKSVFIPIGANVPELPMQVRIDGQNRRTVAIFCLSDPPNVRREVEDISHALRLGCDRGLQLRVVFLGRGTSEATETIGRAFDGVPVEVSNLGLRPAAEVSRVLAECDAMLCVRGKLFPARGSALAGIICGLPIIAYAGASENSPIAEAGVELVPYHDTDALANSLVNVLTNPVRWQEMHEKNLIATQKYFSWESIAEKFLETLGCKTKHV